MILDNNVLFSDKQAIVATANSTNSVDLGANGIAFDGTVLRKKFGVGNKVPLLVLVNSQFNNLTSLDIVLQTASDAAFTVPVEMFRVKVLLADLKKGFICPVEYIPRAGVNQRYVRMRYEVTGAAPTLGSVTAGIVPAVDAAYRGNA